MKMDKTAQKAMARKLQEASKDKINRNIKDSVFCNLFGKPEYLYQLYQALHPEDMETEPDDLTIITLSRVLTRVMYNDLGFVAGNRLIILVEAQSTWTENIVVRFLMYLGETYHRYIEKNNLDIYSEGNVRLPKPELYVVYTGDRKDQPEKISLKRSFFGTEDSCVEVEATVVYDSKAGDILNQYITFCKVYDAQKKLYPGDLRRAVQETIRICREKDVLDEYLANEEAAVIMFEIGDQEKALAMAMEREGRKAREKGMAEGRAQGLAEGYLRLLIMQIAGKVSAGLPLERIHEDLGPGIPEIDALYEAICSAGDDYDPDQILADFLPKQPSKAGA